MIAFTYISYLKGLQLTDGLEINDAQH